MTSDDVRNKLIKYYGFKDYEKTKLARFWGKEDAQHGFILEIGKSPFSNCDELFIYTTKPEEGERCLANIVLTNLANIILLATDENADEWFEEDTVVLEIMLNDTSSFAILLDLPDEEDDMTAEWDDR